MLGFDLEGAEVADLCLPASVSHVLVDGGSALGQQGEQHGSSCTSRG